MGLNSNLISQFAKSTVNKKDENKESVVWATVSNVTESGQCYVKLDGADDGRLIPVETMTETKEGDRVSITIRNHTATLTGSTSSPSASVNGALSTKVTSLETDMLTVNDTLYAENGEFKNLITDVLTVKGTLYAENGEFNNLKANVAEIEVLCASYATIENLNAVNANIHNLLANYATINQLEAEYATIEELTAKTATIGYLDATVGKIDALMFGSASGTSIQTEFANAVVSQIGDAQIKSAMIMDISADKIKSGTINTNYIDVQSEDGSLLIKDATIQIKDNENVRVQIGKDANGDYSIILCDSSGNVMFHEGGITENAVKEAIIRNDMVAGDANISAGKLDIASLFTEINNDGSNIIKSSKIYLNENAQTLDVAFKTMTDSVSDIGSTLSSQGTAISTVLGQISQRIWQQDTANAFDEESRNSPNLVLKSNTPQANASATLHRVARYNVSELLVAGEEYTATICVTPATDITHFIMYLSQSYDGGRCARFNLNGTGTQIISVTFTASYDEDRIPDSTSNASSQPWIYQFPNYNTVTESSTIHWIKIEKGNKATNWTPAPEEMEECITALSTRYSTLEQTVSGINSTVGKIETTFAGNLIKDFSTEKTNADTTNLIAQYNVNSLLVSGEEYKVTICITPAEGAKYLNAYLSQGYGPRTARLYLDGTGATQVVSATLTAAYAEDRIPNDTTDINSRVLVYQYDDSAALKASSTIHWIKVEKYNDAVLTSMQSSIDQTPEQITLAVSSISVGGRNLIRRSKDPTESDIKTYWTNCERKLSSTFDEYAFVISTSTTDGVRANTEGYFRVDPDEEYTLSMLVYRYAPVSSMDLIFRSRSKGSTDSYTDSQSRYNRDLTPTSGKWQKITWTFKTDADAYEGYIAIDNNGSTTDGTEAALWFTNVKLEKGNKATDWTPAPEDMEDRVGDTENLYSDINSTISSYETRLSILENNIKILVTNGIDEHCMDTSVDGTTYTFSTKTIDDKISSNTSDIAGLGQDITDTKTDVAGLDSKLKAWEERAKITTYDDEPCIILNEGDTNYTQIITNTRRIIKEGNNVKSEVNLDTAKFGKVIATNGWQVGNFAWTQPSSNRLRLVWEEDG